MRLSVAIFTDSATYAQSLSFMEDWLKENKEHLTQLRETGCGCCMEQWDIEGPDEILKTIPHTMRMSSNWTRYEPQ